MTIFQIWSDTELVRLSDTILGCSSWICANCYRSSVLLSWIEDVFETSFRICSFFAETCLSKAVESTKNAANGRKKGRNCSSALEHNAWGHYAKIDRWMDVLYWSQAGKWLVSQLNFFFFFFWWIPLIIVASVLFSILLFFPPCFTLFFPLLTCPGFVFPSLRCGSKQGEEDYRPLFENFVQDLLSTVNKPEWPAAELLLSLLGRLLVSMTKPALYRRWIDDRD